MKEKSKHNIKSGIVAFYDILRYGKINENNKIFDSKNMKALLLPNNIEQQIIECDELLNKINQPEM